MGLPVSTTVMLIVGATAAVCHVTLSLMAQFGWRRRWCHNEGSLKGTRGGGHAGALNLSFSSVQLLFSEVAVLGVVMLYCYVCEHAPLFPHAGKVYNRDYFWFVFVVFLGAGALTWQRTREGGRGKSASSPAPPVVLNREQTEEWKGWMQFLFLIYHYYHSKEVYNVIRVLIACYVWMTGFGNFSFFYIKQDFSFARFAQMMWRLNFLVVCLCMTTNNPYVLYYICPLHTFYFLMVLGLMVIGRSNNRSKWGVRRKIMALGLAIFVIWDIPGAFDMVFGFLPRTPGLGAKAGVLHEWHFRSGLDHWAAYIGVIFALSYPLYSYWVRTRCEANAGISSDATRDSRGNAAKAIVGVVLLILAVGWSMYILPLPKFDYNALHPYTFWIPLYSYVFLRNATPWLRSHHMSLLASCGKITLETYLLQHHIWLTSNAKTLLVLVPGYPMLNSLVTTVIYACCSFRVYRTTMVLRGLLLPADSRQCALNICWMCVTVTGFTVIAAGLNYISASLASVALVIAGISTAVMVTLSRVIGYRMALANAESVEMDGVPPQPSTQRIVSVAAKPTIRLYTLTGFLLAATMAVVTTLAGVPQQGTAISSVLRSKVEYSSERCRSALNKGQWTTAPCPEATESHASRQGRWCMTDTWQWSVAGCELRSYSSTEIFGLLSNRPVVSIGDSIARNFHVALARQLGIPTHQQVFKKHGDISLVVPEPLGNKEAKENKGTARTPTKATRVTEGHVRNEARLAFVWAPFLKSVSSTFLNQSRLELKSPSENTPIIVMHAGLWDLLHIHDSKIFHHELEQLRIHLIQMRKQASAVNSGFRQRAPTIVWIETSRVVDRKLATPEKRTHMSLAKVAAQRELVRGSGILDLVDFSIDGWQLTDGRESLDGVHYTERTYGSLVQIFANGLAQVGRKRGKFTSSMAQRTGNTGTMALTATSAQPYDFLFGTSHGGIGINPVLGLLLVILGATMLYTFDAFAGLLTMATALVRDAPMSPAMYEEAMAPFHGHRAERSGQNEAPQAAIAMPRDRKVEP